MDDAFVDNAGFDPFEFELANGNRVKIAFAKFWERLTDLARRAGEQPGQFYAIRVYSSEGELSSQMTFQFEFRANHEFGLVVGPRIWEWLESLTENRGHLKYDTFDDFIEEFGEQIALLSDSAEDAVEHFRHLPEVTDPESFDKVDDSVFNDQNENEPGT